MMSESHPGKAGNVRVLMLLSGLSAAPERRTFLSCDDGQCQVYISSPRAILSQSASS